MAKVDFDRKEPVNMLFILASRVYTEFFPEQRNRGKKGQYLSETRQRVQIKSTKYKIST